MLSQSRDCYCYLLHYFFFIIDYPSLLVILYCYFLVSTLNFIFICFCSLILLIFCKEYQPPFLFFSNLKLRLKEYLNKKSLQTFLNNQQNHIILQTLIRPISANKTSLQLLFFKIEKMISKTFITHINVSQL